MNTAEEVPLGERMIAPQVRYSHAVDAESTKKKKKKRANISKHFQL